MKLIDNESGNISKGITLDSNNKADKYKLSYNCSDIGSGKSYIRIYATLTDNSYRTYFMPIQFSGNVELELSIDQAANFLQFDAIGDAALTRITLETVTDATMEYVKENSKYWDVIKDVTSSTGKLKSELLEGIINTSLNKIFAPGYLNEGNTSIWETETEATMINPDGMYRANSKKSDGNWDWKPFTAGAGINADAIVTGILRAITISGVDITGSSIVGGTITGVTIEGSTIYAGDRESGDYVEITQEGIINGYAGGKKTMSLLRRPSNGILRLGGDIDAGEYIEIHSRGSITVGGTNAFEGYKIGAGKSDKDIIIDTQGIGSMKRNIYINGSIYCTGRICKEWNGGFKTGDYTEL